MDLMIKNEHVLDLLNESNRTSNFTAKEEQAYLEKLDAVQRAEYVLSGYVADMLRDSIEVHRELDLSYGTVGNLPAVLGLRLREIRDMKTPWQDSVASLAKSLAAYLFFLAMNEHGCALKVTQMGTPFAPPLKSEEPLWGDLFRYKTGVRREVDFLPAVMESMQKIPLPGNPLMTLTVSPIIRAYRSATGVDLSEYGFSDMALES